MRPRGYRWRDDPEALEAWTEGRTGIPIVDAGMRQLAREGWMHNRARLITASFLTKHLCLDWRAGARHFFDLLVDGDVANNIGNWQWVAGTGADTRPNRVLNPIRQARRFDPEGDYVRRYVTELAEVTGPGIHEPWTLGRLRPSGYPDPIVDLATGALRFREMRGLPGPRRGRPRQSP
jgi:deoxyribodipyrimidine photo-lyase